MNYEDAIAGIESSGRYDLLGPVTRRGDRAYGKYQVMGANIPEWTKAALGRSMTPEEFLADQKAQDEVFQHRFGGYANKYGPEGAARAWFAGEGGMNDMGRRDQLGTSVADYAGKFNRAMGMAAPEEQPAAGLPSEITRGYSEGATSPPRNLEPFLRPDQQNGLEDGLQKFWTGLMAASGNSQGAAALASMQNKRGGRRAIQGKDGAFYEYDERSGQLRRLSDATVAPPETAIQKQLAEQDAKGLFKQREAAQGAIQSLESGLQSRKLLDSGIITGSGADWKLTFGRFAKDNLGWNPMGDDLIANTDAYIAERGKAVGQIIKQFGSGTGLSNADREYAEAIAAGKITRDEKALRRILELEEKASRSLIDNYNKEVGKLPPGAAPRSLVIELPEHLRSPYMSPSAPAAGATSAPARNIKDFIRR